ncbi:MAG: TetR/AcrR family transcriptional regulator [Neomegalonema sp.]|nr:TetR/AcrR family transcriptional regulator [Neomegalonema sp.]
MARKPGSNGEETAALVREAALELFAQQGYAAASMRQLAKLVDMRPSALYHYWPTKQDLLVDLLERHMTALLQAWAERAVELSNDPIERLDAFSRFHIRYHLARPNEVFLSYMELRNLEPQNFARIEAHRRHYESVLKDILIEGARIGAMQAPEPHVSAMAIIAMLTGVNTWYRDGGRLSASDVEQLYAEMAAAVVRVGRQNKTEAA